jgi:D-alanine-D-alanine ligase-like ATP-grasp enzyme
MNKYITKQLWKLAKLPVARDMMMYRDMTHGQIHGVIASFNYHCVVKAIGEGSSK